jgi:Protein of unknown function (DUF817)
MPLVLAIALVAFFIWVAENISTFLGAWVYPQQRHGWSIVSLRIMSSWFLMVIVSGIIVADLKHVRDSARKRLENDVDTEESLGGPIRVAVTERVESAPPLLPRYG